MASSSIKQIVGDALNSLEDVRNIEDVPDLLQLALSAARPLVAGIKQNKL